MIVGIGLLVAVALALSFRHMRTKPDPQGTFAIFEGKQDGHRLVVTLDTSLSHFGDKSEFPYFLVVHTELANPTVEGLTTKAEADELNAWEEVVDGRLKAATKTVFVGRVTWNGRRELLYYVKSDRLAKETLTKLSSAKSARSFSFSCERDDGWKKVESYLNSR